MLGDLTLETLIPSLINLLYLSEDPHRFEEFASEAPGLFFGPTETRWHTAVMFDHPSMEKYWNAASRLAFQPIPFETSPLSGVPLGSLFTLSATSYGLGVGYMVGAIVGGPALGILLTGPLGAVIGYFGAALARGAARPTEELGEQLAAKLLRLLVPDFVFMETLLSKMNLQAIQRKISSRLKYAKSCRRLVLNVSPRTPPPSPSTSYIAQAVAVSSPGMIGCKCPA